MFACMTIVPALAMFSHQLPAGVREALRTRLWDPAEDWIASLTSRAPIQSVEKSCEPAEDEALADTPSEPVGAAGGGPVPMESPSSSPLAALGATSIDCRPFDGLAGNHVASCRMAVDAAGQLHRVFQAAGPSPEEAYASLLETVRAWKERTAGRLATPRL